MYPFNTENGCKETIGIFGAQLPDGTFHSDFDNRDGQMLIGFDTDEPYPPPHPCTVDPPPQCDPSVAPIPAGLGPESYHVVWARVTVEIANNEEYIYDPTQDPWQSWLLPGDLEYVPDVDAGRPVELYGTGFRNGWSASTFPEDGPFCSCSCFPPALCKLVRNAYATDNALCAARDVSNNIDDGFDPAPFAIGVNDELEPGQFVPWFTDLTFEINLGPQCVRDYLAEALDEGMLDLAISGIWPAEEQVPGAFPYLFAKESPIVSGGLAEAARLEMSVYTGPFGDIDGDGIVGVNDFLLVLGTWGPCDAPCPPICQGDLDGDCIVGINDFLIVLSNWTEGL